MAYPSRADYAQAVGGFPHVSILDTTLRSGTPARGANNLLLVYSGGFSSVFPLVVGPNTFALRCWVRDIGDAETRYQEISNYLRQNNLPYFVEFTYIREGILVNGTKWPITRMEWAEGDKLCDFIERSLNDAPLLRTAAAEFLKMVETLHANQISHGDLQDGNILLKRTGPDVEIKLIDYDSVFVPALQGYPDSIVGLPQYQHPSRIAGSGIASEKADYFSELVIYLSLLAIAEEPALWSQFNGGIDGALLFVAADFSNPAQSRIFRELANLSPEVQSLTAKLRDFCVRTSIDQLEPLEALLPRIDPVATRACNQGLIFLHSQRYNEAVAEFERAIRIESNYLEAHHGLGLTYLGIGNLDLAKTKAEDTLRIDANYQPALQLLDTIRQLQRNVRPPRPASTPPVSQSRSQPSPSKDSTIQQIINYVTTFLQRRRHYVNRGMLIVCAAAVILFLIYPRNGPNPPLIPEVGSKKNSKENNANGARSSTNSSSGSGQSSLPATIKGSDSDDVGITSTRSDPKKIIPSDTSEDDNSNGDNTIVTVAINAVPWAEVFIRLPGANSYTKPKKKPNITPIPGGLNVQIGTTIKLVYGDKEKVFGYDEWYLEKRISHDFLNP